MELSRYSIDSNGRLVWTPLPIKGVSKLSKDYIVWGVGKEGLLHGTGAFLGRQRMKVDCFIINIPTFNEIAEYRVNRDNLFK